MIFGRTFIAFPRYAFAILAFLATVSVFGFSASVFADSSSSAVYGDEGSVENSSNFSVTVEELNALELRLSASDLVLDLNPTSDAPVFGSSDLSVTVYTTNTTGYYLTMTPTYQSVATTNLTRTESLSGSYPTIATLSSTASPSTFASTSDTTTSNKWGYKVNTTNLSTVDTTIYNPTIAASIPLNKTNTPINTGDETDITFAAKVDSDTPAGSYKVDLNFTAITNANTYSITFNPGSASSDASLVSMPSPNPQTGALESGSSTSITLSSSTPTRAGYSFLGWCSVAPTTSNNTDSCSGTTYQPSDSTTIYTDTPDITLYAMWEANSYIVTFAANGGTTTPESQSTISSITLPSAISYHTASTTNTSTTYATFAGWNTAPDGSGTTYSAGSSYTPTADTTLYATWDFNSGTLQGAAQSSAASCGANLVDARTGVSYLTYTISNKCYMEQNLYLPTGFTLYAGDSNIYSMAASKNQKLSWTTPSSSTMPSNSYDTPYMVTGSYSNNTYNATGGWYNYCAASAGTVCHEHTEENANSDICPKGWRLPTNSEMGNVKSAARSNWKFYAGYYGDGSLQNDSSTSSWWSATKLSSSNQLYLRYYDGSLNIYGSNKRYGYFVRCVSDSVAEMPIMQNYTKSTMASIAPNVGDVVAMKDSRDDQIYLVGHAADGEYWMLQNLKLGSNSTSLSLTTANSTVLSSGFTLSNKLSDGKFPRASSTSGTDAYYQYDGSAYYCTSDYGCYYNWYTATAGSGTGSASSGNVSYSICSKGWNLPTGGSNGQFQTLYNQYNSASLLLVDSPTSTKDNTAGKIPGFLLGGLYLASGAHGVGSGGFYWSRTANGARNGYSLYLNTSDVNTTSYDYKYVGSAVRCVAV